MKKCPKVLHMIVFGLTFLSLCGICDVFVCVLCKLVFGGLGWSLNDAAAPIFFFRKRLFTSPVPVSAYKPLNKELLTGTVNNFYFFF